MVTCIFQIIFAAGLFNGQRDSRRTTRLFSGQIVGSWLNGRLLNILIAGALLCFCGYRHHVGIIRPRNRRCARYGLGFCAANRKRNVFRLSVLNRHRIRCGVGVVRRVCCGDGCGAVIQGRYRNGFCGYTGFHRSQRDCILALTGSSERNHIRIIDRPDYLFAGGQGCCSANGQGGRAGCRDLYLFHGLAKGGNGVGSFADNVCFSLIAGVVRPDAEHGAGRGLDGATLEDMAVKAAGLLCAALPIALAQHPVIIAVGVDELEALSCQIGGRHGGIALPAA